MPYADLATSDLQIYWTSNIPGDDLSVLRSHPKPVVVMMHAIMLSTEWRSEQMTDSLLSDSCYMIAFDGVVSGKTRCPNYISSGLVYEHDAWAEAAMIALFAQALDLPPFHLFAEQANATGAAKRFTALFPNQCLSLTLLAVFPPDDEEWFLDAYMQAAVAWVQATDIEVLEEAQASFAYLYFSTHTTPNNLTDDEMDRLMEHFQVNHGPPDAARGLLGSCINIKLRQSVPPNEYALIRQPVLIIQGNASPVHSIQVAYDLQALFVNGNCHVEAIPGGCACIAVPSRFAPAVNRAFFEFIFEQCPEGHDHSAPCTVDDADMRRALTQLASLAGDASIAQKDPLSMWSYCRLPPAARAEVKDVLVPIFVKAAQDAQTLLTPDGRPLRKYSERLETAVFSPSDSSHDLGISMTTTEA